MGANTLLRSSEREETTHEAATPEERRIEDVRVRNYDDTRHRIEVAVAGDGADIEESYVLAPGETRTETGALDPGEYTVSVTVDGDQHATTTCRIEDGTEAVAVETGNGIVSVTGSRY